MCHKFFRDIYQEHRAESFCKALDELCMKYKMIIPESFTLYDALNKEVVCEEMEMEYQFALAWYKWKKEREANR